MSIDNLDHHHGASQPPPPPIHVTNVAPLTAAAAAAAHMHSSTQMTQVTPPQPIFISTTENRQAQMDLIHRQQARRPLPTTRRHFTRIHWPTPPPSHHSHPHHPHSHHHHPGGPG